MATFEEVVLNECLEEGFQRETCEKTILSQCPCPSYVGVVLAYDSFNTKL